ncbi:MAG: galactose-1-phosphate uridylyltransferase [candidate division KSB1 bacterium]|nr:galactose-1-phosphate uridylyltransferase [candidate division KSB1 bacterium]
MAINQLRKDPISGRWTIIVENEVDIPTLIETARNKSTSTHQTVSRCQFCEGNESQTPPEIMSVRTSGTQANVPGWRVRVIPDKAPVLQIYGDLNNRAHGIYDVLDGIGAHEIVIESPRHGETLVDLSEQHISEILWTYKQRILDLKQDVRFRYILVHKNYGEAVGLAARHSYSYVIATPITPGRVKDELINSMDYYQYKERCVFCDMIRQELSEQTHIVSENAHFVAIAPFASRNPFEVWILPKQHETFFEWNSNLEALAAMLKEILFKLYTVLQDPQFVMVLHSGPNVRTGQRRGYWKSLEKDYHWHFEIKPRLAAYTSFEIGSGFTVNFVAPEKAAQILRETK